MNKKYYRKIALTLVLVMLLVISSVFSNPVKAETKTVTFKDVPIGHVFYSSVMDLVARDITQGYGDGYFGEKDPITRAQIAVMIVRARPDLNPRGMKSEFKDVPAGYWAEGEIAAAKKAGILDGYGDGRFGPDDNITRAQLSKMVVNAFNIKADTKNPVKFSDVRSSYWAEECISALASNDIVGGYGGGLFRPDYQATRGQFAKYLSNTLMLVDQGEIEEPEHEFVENKTITLNFEFGARTGQYTGNLVNGLPHGQGTFTVGDSWEYEGEWQKGHMEGEGTTTWDSGQVYNGTYVQDYFIQGEVILLYENGTKYYEGGWADDLYHGNGTLYDYHGEVIYSGRFNNDYIAESTSEYETRKTNIQAKSKACDVYDLKKLCEAEEHEYCKVWGQVINVEQYDGYAWIQIDDQGIDSRDRVISIEYRLSEGEILPELWDYIDVWGTTQYMYSYEAVGGFDMNTPLLYGLVIETWY